MKLATPAEKLGDNAVNGLAWLTALSRLYTDKGFLSAVADRSALAIPHISPPMRRLDRRQHYHRHGAIQRMSGHAIASQKQKPRHRWEPVSGARASNNQEKVERNNAYRILTAAASA